MGTASGDCSDCDLSAGLNPEREGRKVLLALSQMKDVERRHSKCDARINWSHLLTHRLPLRKEAEAGGGVALWHDLTHFLPLADGSSPPPSLHPSLLSALVASERKLLKWET